MGTFITNKGFSISEKTISAVDTDLLPWKMELPSWKKFFP